MSMHDPKHWTAHAVRWLEMVMAVVVLIAIIASFVNSVGLLRESDWTRIETLYDALNRILLIVIGLEIIRILFVRDLVSVLELLAFVVARKMLKPDMSSLDLALGTVAFMVLIITRYSIDYFQHRSMHRRAVQSPDAQT